MSGSLAGKTAVVTGTAHGIGACIADALRGDGAKVHGADKDAVDLSVPAAVAEFFAGVGPADILVNCAGGVAGQVGLRGRGGDRQPASAGLRDLSRGRARG